MSSVMYVGKIPQDIKMAIQCRFTELDQIEISDPVAALLVHKQKKPDVVFVDANMKLLNGFSFSAIISGYKENCEIFILYKNIEKPNTIGLTDVNIINYPYDIMKIIKDVQSALDKHEDIRKNKVFSWSSRTGNSIEQIKTDQKKVFPKAISRKNGLNVDFIFSPYSDFSGDCLDFWYSETENIVYGFLFDCTGHDVHSYTQVREMRTLFHLMFRLRRNSLNIWLQNVNNELFRLYNDDTYCTAAVTFEINLNTCVLTYCSAGIPYFWINKHGEYKQIFMENFLIGCEPGCSFEEQQINIYPGKEVIFCSDGLSELIGKDLAKLKRPQQDDISSIFINLDGGFRDALYKN